LGKPAKQKKLLRRAGIQGASQAWLGSEMLAAGFEPALPHPEKQFF
jgi:hypothetical protein